MRYQPRIRQILLIMLQFGYYGFMLKPWKLCFSAIYAQSINSRAQVANMWDQNQARLVSCVRLKGEGFNRQDLSSIFWAFLAPQPQGPINGLKCAKNAFKIWISAPLAPKILKIFEKFLQILLKFCLKIAIFGGKLAFSDKNVQKFCRNVQKFCGNPLRKNFENLR